MNKMHIQPVETTKNKFLGDLYEDRDSITSWIKQAKKHPNYKYDKMIQKLVVTAIMYLEINDYSHHKEGIPTLEHNEQMNIILKDLEKYNYKGSPRMLLIALKLAVKTVSEYI